MRKVVFELENDSEDVFKLQLEGSKDDLTSLEAQEMANKIASANVFEVKNKPVIKAKAGYIIDENKIELF